MHLNNAYNIIKQLFKMSSLTAQLAELKTLISQAEEEVLSLLGGKKASAPRARGSLQKIKALSQLMRKSIMEHVSSLPTKERTKKENIPAPPELVREVPVEAPVETPTPVSPPARKKGKKN